MYDGGSVLFTATKLDYSKVPSTGTDTTALL